MVKKSLLVTVILAFISTITPLGVAAQNIHGNSVDSTVGYKIGGSYGSNMSFPVSTGSATKWWQDPIIRMNRDCGIVGSGDETAALNTCIANLVNYTGVLQCDKPGMSISTTGVVVRDKIGIRIEAAGGTQSLNNACQLVYTGSTGGTVVDVERTRDSVIFKGFQVYCGNCDIGFQTGQTGTGTNIATSDSFEEIQLSNNASRSTFIGFKIGDGTGNNSDEMKFKNLTISSGTRSGTAFKNVITNVYGSEFHNIVLYSITTGWDWYNPASIDKVNGYDIGLLYKLNGGNGMTFHVQHEDLEQVDQILSGGGQNFVEENSRVILNTPGGGGSTGTAGHPAWDATSAIRIRKMELGPPQWLVGMTFLNGTNQATADIDFYDPGLVTFSTVTSPPPFNALNFQLAPIFLSGAWGYAVTPWLGGGFVDEKGMMMPGVGSMLTNSGLGLRVDSSPCTRGNLCLNEGQIELTGIHSIFNVPTISYTGAAGATSRYYSVVACDDTSCAVGHRSIPSAAIGKTNTQAALDGSDYITLTWTPALGVNKYGILQQQTGSPTNWNLLMSNVSCATNPCTVNITTDSVTYVSGYPSDNETGGAILRGAIKLGKSATQVAAVDFTYATVTGLSPATYGTATNCAVNSVSPAACGSAASGAFVVPTTTATYTVNTSAAGTHSRIFLQPITFASDLPSSPTCVAPLLTTDYSISAVSNGVSFTMALTSTTGQTCWMYWIVN